MTVKIIGTFGSSQDISLSTADVTELTIPGNPEVPLQIRTQALDLGSNVGIPFLLRLSLNEELETTIFKVRDRFSRRSVGKRSVFSAIRR